MSVSDARRESREADERRGWGCPSCAWSSWFDEAVDFGWWCNQRRDFIGEPIICGEYVTKGEAGTDVRPVG